MRAEEFVKIDAGLAVPAPPPYKPDPELIGYIEQGQKGPGDESKPMDVISRQRVLAFIDAAVAAWGFHPIAAAALDGVREAVTEEPGA